MIHMIYSTGGTISIFLPAISLSNHRQKTKICALDNAVLSRLLINMIMPKSKLLAFSEEDKDGVAFLNWDPLVISAKIMGAVVHGIMSENRSFCHILFKRTLDQLGDFHNYVEPCEIGIRIWKLVF